MAFNTRDFLFNVMYKMAIDITDAIREFVKNEDSEYKFVYPSMYRYSVGMRDEHYIINIIKRNNTDAEDIEVDDNGKVKNFSELAIIDFNYLENTITFKITDKNFGDKFDIDVNKKSCKSILKKYYMNDRLYALGTIFSGKLNEFYPKSYVELLAKFDNIINTNVKGIYNTLDKHYNDVSAVYCDKMINICPNSDEEDVDLP